MVSFTKAKTKRENTYEINRDLIDATPTKEPNPKWKYKCKCERIYTWKKLPKFISINYLIDLACPQFVCHDCDKPIPTSSMYKTPKWRTFMPGQIELKINGCSVTKEEFIKEFKKDHPKINLDL